MNVRELIAELQKYDGDRPVEIGRQEADDYSAWQVYNQEPYVTTDGRWVTIQ